jgi:cytochrome P460
MQEIKAGAPLRWDVLVSQAARSCPRPLPAQAFLIEKDSKRFPKTGGWGYALFNHDTATGKMTADEAKSDCGHACHVAVKAKDYIFHPYQKR